MRIAPLLVTAIAFAQSPSADQVLARARAASGGARLAEIHTLMVTGYMDRNTAAGTQTADVEIRIELPSRYLRQSIPVIAGGPATPPVQLQCLDGERAWAHTIFPPGTLLNGEPPSEVGRDLDDAGRTSLVRELNRYLLAFTLSTSPDFPLTFTYDRESDEVVGQGPGDFLIRLLFDSGTHRLATLTYSSLAHLKLDDFRDEGGVVFPHALTAVTSATTDKLVVKKFHVNPVFPKNTFRKPS